MNLNTFDRASGPARGTDYPVYSDALLDWYQTKNVRAVRLMFTWEAAQSAFNGPVPAAGPGYADYWADLTNVVARLLARGIYVTLAPWQYNKFVNDTDIVYDSAAFGRDDFADFWGKFAAAMNTATGNDPRVAFDLINEPREPRPDMPGDVGISLIDWFACAQAAILAIRGAGATNTIFVPGMDWAAASEFVGNGSADAWLKLNDPGDNLAVTVHCYAKPDPPATVTLLSEIASAVVNWAELKHVKIHIGEIAIDAGAPTGDYEVADQQWKHWDSFCAAHETVIVGWNWWANSAANTPETTWWDDGDSANGERWGLTLDDGATQTVYMKLIERTLA